MENIHVAQVALMFLETAKKKIAEASISNPPKPFSQASRDEITGYIAYAYEFIEKVLERGIKTI